MDTCLGQLFVMMCQRERARHHAYKDDIARLMDTMPGYPPCLGAIEEGEFWLAYDTWRAHKGPQARWVSAAPAAR